MESKKKAVNWKKVYIFISSTFNDMHAERDYLVKNVFPELSEWCEKRKLRMVDIDLRWGVTEADATHNKNVVNVCLNRIDECRPFFLCFLGQRYGWVPERKDISPETFGKFPGLEETVNKGASVTELEVLHSLVSPFHSLQTIAEKGFHPSQYAFFYLRDDAYFSDIPVEPVYRRRIYSDSEEESEINKEELQQKREELIRKIKEIKRPYHVYQAVWSGDRRTPEIAMPLKCPATIAENQQRWREDWKNYANVRVTGLDVEENPDESSKAKEFNKRITKGRLANLKCEGKELGKAILEELKRSIAEHFPDHKEIERPKELQKEIDQQEQFVFISSEGFIHRKGDFWDLDNYVGSDSNRLFVLTAEAGMGKSTLLANWVDHSRIKLREEPGQSIHFRFIGASDGSTTIYSLLHLLLKEIKEISGKLDEEIPDDPQKLRKAFPDLLEKIGSKGKTVIVLDALNQLEAGLSDLSWLPRKLPKNIKLIVSFKRGKKEAEDLFHSFASDEEMYMAGVKPFIDREDRRMLIQAYLSQYLKELDEANIESLIKSEAARNPLFLKIVLSELRVFGAFTNLGEKIRNDFGDTPLSAFAAVLARLEKDPAYSPIQPQEAVPLLFGLMAHTQRGLSAEELTSLFIQALNMENNEGNQTKARDTIYLFLRQVRPFLAHRHGRYDFFYESFKQAALKKYVSEEEKIPKRKVQSWHILLANFFYGLTLPNSRKAAELPFHLVHAQDWQRLEQTLCDLEFVEAKCAAGMTYDLIADYNAALNNLPEAQKEKRRKQEYEQQIQKHVEDLTAYTRARKDARWRYRKDPENYPLSELEKIGLPEIITAVEHWSDKKIKHDNERIIHRPERLDRIRTFLQFANSESHGLVKFGAIPGYCLQQAYNSSNLGTVATAAEAIISTQKDKTMLLKHPSQRPRFNPHSALLRTIEADTKPISSVNITPDGKQTISDLLRIWDVESGELIRELAVHEIDSYVFRGRYGGDITIDGKRHVKVSKEDKKVFQVWDKDSGECLAECKVPKTRDAIVKTAAKKKLAVKLSEKDNKVIEVLDLDSGKCLRKLTDHKDSIYSLTIIEDESYILSKSYDQTFIYWDLVSGECLRVFGLVLWDAREIKKLGITLDGKQVVSSSLDGALRIWDVKSGKCLRTLIGHTEAVDIFKITDDGKRIISGSTKEFNILRLWDVDTGECLRKINAGSAQIKCLDITPDGKLAVSGRREGLVQLWDLAKGTYETGILRAPVMSLTLSPDGKLGASGLVDDEIRLWDLESGEPLRKFKHQTFIDKIRITPDGNKVVSTDKNHLNLYIWDVESGTCQKKLRSNTDRIHDWDITPDGKLVVTGHEQKVLRVWELESGEHLRTLEGHTKIVLCVNITPDGRRLVSESSDNSNLIWDLESGKCLQKHKDYRKNYGITPDGKLMVSLRHKTLILWNLKTGECLAEAIADVKWTEQTGICITPDGKKIVVCGSSNAIWIWDFKNSSSMTGLEGHHDWINNVRITPDSKRMVSASKDLTIRVWDLERNVCTAAILEKSIVFSISEIKPNGNFSYGTFDGEVISVRPMNFPTESPVVTAVRLWRFGENGKKGKWEEKIKTACQWCGQRFTVSDEILDKINSIIQNANLSTDQSPCWELPEEAWDDPQLLSNCSLCHKPLRFNPFIVDSKDQKYKPLRGKILARAHKEKSSPAARVSPESKEKFASTLKADAHCNTAAEYLNKKMYEEAIREYQAAIHIKPDHAVAHCYLGLVYNMQGRIKVAIQKYKDALRIDPNLVEARSNLGSVLLKDNRIKEAIQECETVLRLKPNNISAHYNLGVIYDRQGRLEEAIGKIQRAYDLGFTQARTFLDKLKVKRNKS